jgi:epsilon-lactone hydrolase
VSLRLRFLAGTLRPVMRWRMGRVNDPANVRRMMDRAGRYLFRAPRHATYVRATYPSDRLRAAVWAAAGPVSDNLVILYVHGGAYLAGSAWGYRKLAAQLAHASGLRVFVPDYRLAPEHRLPGALEDVLAAHAYLLSLGHAPNEIVIGGDSAGGGLAFALLAELCARGQQPAAVFGWSPCLDLTFTGASVLENARRDHLFPGHRAQDLNGFVLGDVAAEDPRVSPLFARFPGCPPVLLQVSDSEILRDDSTRMDARLRAEGVDVHLEMWHDAPHVWQMMAGYVPEATRAIADTAAFIRAQRRSGS